ncbi:MAG: UDP-3-O-(3-hydroxymyristoyl)glucosamine N-acyltransferase [Deltaproteobacteria bacterium]|nr:UDP-3-O-(3-hydroxymyristoyl)glucosamine N-acyltransferase [Deltaproteobacteria bacterium]MBM4316471.1 UDP-3-O-(3-hydroxymyristoyl)glucosamine N-acyltransferase [Deltaproteobacteria bacterium]
MGTLEFPTTAGKIAEAFNATLLGNPEAGVNTLNSVQNAKQGSLCFLGDKKNQTYLESLESSVVVLTRKELVRKDLAVTYVLVDEPKAIFAQLAKSFAPKTSWKGISDRAEIHPLAKIDPTASVGPFAVIGEGAQIGAYTVIYPQAYVGTGVKVGSHCEIHPQVSLITNVFIGDRVKIFSGSVLGSDGFGLVETEGGPLEMPQLGTVVVEDDVRIGAHCTIDRGTLGETIIGRGSKLDDQVHIGHNCRLERNTILCAQVGLAGSSTLEEGVVLAGQVGVGDHITIGKGARVGGQTGVTSDLKGGETYFSTPALPVRQALRAHVFFRELPKWVERIKLLEKEIHGYTKS